MRARGPVRSHDGTFYFVSEVRVLAAILALATLLLAVRWVELERRPAPSVGLEVSPGARVDLNHASLDALTVLPGVGRVGAARLITGRPYRAWEDVERQVGAGVAERLRGWATIGDSPSDGQSAASSRPPR